MTATPEKVLLVDDDLNLLAAFKRQFHNQLNLVTASGGEDGMTAIRDKGPFAVAISDMQMPQMDGVEFLSLVRKEAPDTVRIMLTGNANLKVAMDSVNEGNIFRFLTKPCARENLYKTIVSGIDQYRLHEAEKELLGKTLRGAVDLLTDVLSLVNPEAFSQASRIKRYVRQMVSTLSLDDAWSYELAAMLSPLGCITLPAALLEKVSSGVELPQNEQQIYAEHPKIGARLLQHIPRLESVSGMVELQNSSAMLPDVRDGLGKEEKSILGGHMLKIAIELDQQINSGRSYKEALKSLTQQPAAYHPGLVAALAGIDAAHSSVQILALSVSQLEPGMILDQEIIAAKTGTLLVARGQEISEAILYRLAALEQNSMISGSIRVMKQNKAQ